MCGIVGYIGSKNALSVVLNGLKELQYRGYDSCGYAGLDENSQLHFLKKVGKIKELEEEIPDSHTSLKLAISHTRWATHGKPTELNAHPHFDKDHTTAVVHNGIIENHAALREMLIKKGRSFVSDTDTEVIAQLISEFYQGDILDAVQKGLSLCKGAWAILVIHKDFPDTIIAAAHDMPLVIGLGDNEIFISSDTKTFGKAAKKVIFFESGEVAKIQSDLYEIYDSAFLPITKELSDYVHEAEEVSKGDWEHFTLKEIFEQPQALRSSLAGRCLEEYGTASFETLTIDPSELKAVEKILILACGTSWHAGCIARELLEAQARIPTQVEISSEFRMKNPLISPNTLVIAISQSGETADTLAAIRELKAKGTKVLAVCNVQTSSLAREADASLFLRAGPEIGVCSTKAFTSQVIVLSLFSLLMARMRHLGREDGQEFIKKILEVPTLVEQVLTKASSIAKLAKKYSSIQNFFFIGRSFMFISALEGALKLKEISYINANGYPAGELKHGPIALINPQTVVVALLANKHTLPKMLSNLTEVKAREGILLAFADENTPDISSIADDIIRVPETIDPLAVIPTSVALQLFAYYMALELKREIDQPRNLAKSVTVE